MPCATLMHPHMHMPDCILAPKMCSAADAGLSPIPCSTLRIAAPFFGAGREHAACADGQATRLPYVGLRPATGRRYNGSSGCPLLRGYEMNRAELQALAELRISEAQALLTLPAPMPDGAYYLAGYAVECALKACIARGYGPEEWPETWIRARW